MRTNAKAIRDTDNIRVVMHGLGGVGLPIAKQVLAARDIILQDVVLVGADVFEKYGSQVMDISINHNKTWQTMYLEKPERHREVLRDLSEKYGATDHLIVVDFSHASALNDLATMCVELGIDFVSGTTGGDREAFEKIVSEGSICAVIDKNMSITIAGLINMIQYQTIVNPAFVKGWTVIIYERHQWYKGDISGTALLITEILKEAGIRNVKIIPLRIGKDPSQIDDKFVKSLDDIEDPTARSLLAEVENENGHGYHLLRFKSPNNVGFGFYTKVDGRDAYGPGTIAAIRYLSKNAVIAKIYRMSDVLGLFSPDLIKKVKNEIYINSIVS